MGTLPSELELKILRRIWAHSGAATVRQVLDGWPETKVPRYTTVLKTLQIMERKGYVRHEKLGRAYRYKAAIRREQHVRGRFREMLHGLAGRDRVDLVSALVDEMDLTREEIAEVRKMLSSRRKRGES